MNYCGDIRLNDKDNFWNYPSRPLTSVKKTRTYIKTLLKQKRKLYPDSYGVIYVMASEGWKEIARVYTP